MANCLCSANLKKETTMIVAVPDVSSKITPGHARAVQMIIDRVEKKRLEIIWIERYRTCLY